MKRFPKNITNNLDLFSISKVKSQTNPSDENCFLSESLDKKKLRNIDIQLNHRALIDFMELKEQDKIGEYQHFVVYLDIKQYYLGRVFIWAKRLDAATEFDLTEEEYLELRKIKNDLKTMYELTFKPDMLNTAFLGNSMNHCHCHVIPRYQSHRKIKIGEDVFCDENYGQNYSRPNTKAFQITPETMECIKTELRSALVLASENNPTESMITSMKMRKNPIY